jgi:hypothetical protein
MFASRSYLANGPGPRFTCQARPGTPAARQLAGHAVPAHVSRPTAPARHSWLTGRHVSPFGSRGEKQPDLSVFFPVLLFRKNRTNSKKFRKMQIYDKISYGIKLALLDVASLKNLTSRDKKKKVQLL